MPTENNQCNNLQYYRTSLRKIGKKSLNLDFNQLNFNVGSLVHFLKKSTPLPPSLPWPQGGATPSPLSRAARASLGHHHGAEAGAAEEQVGWSRFRREECCLPIWTGGSSHDLVQSGFWTIVCKSNWGCSPLSKWRFYGWVKWELLTTYWDHPPSSWWFDPTVMHGCLVASRFGIIQLENLGHFFEKHVSRFLLGGAYK